MENSKIEWTHHTFNPWIGCSKASPGCVNCYAETLNERWAWGAQWVKGGNRHKTSAANWEKPLGWNKAAQKRGERLRVFCASLADVFETNAKDQMHEWREELHHELILKTPWLNWLLLTKRPEHIASYYGTREIPFNVWLGTSVESQTYANRRLPHLLSNNATVRFLSCEPLLGPLDLRPWLEGIHWVIVGGESGPNFREMNPDWVRDIRDQCVEAGVAFNFKQWSGRNPHKLGRELDGKVWDEFPDAQNVAAKCG
jgi:protein gp37